MDTPPFAHEIFCPWLKTASQDPTVGNDHLNFFASIPRMEVRRRVFIMKHADHNSEEPAHLWHGQILLVSPPCARAAATSGIDIAADRATARSRSAASSAASSRRARRGIRAALPAAPWLRRERDAARR